jgi:F420-dependent oxidoreductase-like protein
MRIGIFGDTATTNSFDAVISAAKAAANDGFATYWMPQVFGLDALTALAIVGREVDGIELGTSVVPTYPRHPWVMAQQAITTQVATGGRLCLGIGLSHKIVIESMWGLSFEKPLRHMSDYLDILVPLSQGQAVSVNGETISANGALDITGATPFEIVVAALGPKMLELAGRRTDGTLTWCVGPATLAALTIPTIREAAERAGRAVPRVIAGMPICVTDNPAAARERAAKVFAIYPQLPSYRAMLDREGVASAADIAIAGSEDEVNEQVQALADMGVTDLAAVEFGGPAEERERTRYVLKELVPTLG